MFALSIEFLTGTAVMTSADSRETAEWPPHPARVFMALVAAHYETRPLPEDGEEALKSWSEERLCLEWLEKQNAPALQFADVPLAHRRSVHNIYVPVNDQPIRKSVEPDDGPFNGADLLSLRHRIDRTFPAVSLGLSGQRNEVHVIWQESTLPTELSAAFQRLAAKVIRIGHSSSLTKLWIAEPVPQLDVTLSPVASTKPIRGGVKLRSIAPGLLADLDQRFNADNINAFFELSQQIKDTSGKAKVTAKEAFKARFAEDHTASLAAPVRRRPFIGTSQTYAPPVSADRPIVGSVFDPEILILTKQEGRVLGLESTNTLIEALRGTLLTGSESAPPWFTGHREQGEPADKPHLALLPLAYVGTEYADGHVLGLALAFPKAVPAKDRGEQLKRIFKLDPDGNEEGITLKLGNHGTWNLQREERSSRSRPIALRAETWTEASTLWASVTPVALDRHPKLDPSDPKEREAWRQEVAGIISEACVNIGLPKPVAVDIDKTSWHRGAPRSRPGPNGMPWLTSKMGSARQQVHVLLQFDCEVDGPVLIGAGRYRGYGVCKPLGLANS
jgi:CRISPR-associated protein Csb2